MSALTVSLPRDDSLFFRRTTVVVRPRSGSVTVATSDAERLHFGAEHGPGYRREGRLGAFRYRRDDGKILTDKAELERIRKLVLPPAWTEVWITRSPHAHLQAIGRDARGRKQYRYHERWRASREQTKFAHMAEFGAALPKLRRQVARDLRGRPDAGTTALAAVTRLLELTLIRVGNEEYVKQNKSYGLSTLRDRHVKIRGPKLHFRFRGKSGKEHELEVEDRRVAAVVRTLQDLPGQDLFQYRAEDGRLVNLTSSDINDYLRRTTGREITAKDFRTWSATVEAARLLGHSHINGGPHTKAEVARVIKEVSTRLGNTPAICRKSYIHPGVVETFLEAGAVWPFVQQEGGKTESTAKIERALLRFLKKYRSKPAAAAR